MSESLNERLQTLIAHWKWEGKRCYDIAHERSRMNPERSIMAQSVRYWECARELEECLVGSRVSDGKASKHGRAKDPQAVATAMKGKS